MPAKKSKKAPVIHSALHNGKTAEQIRIEMRAFDAALSRRRASEREEESALQTLGAKPILSIGDALKDIKPELDQMLLRVQRQREEHRLHYIPLIQESPPERECPMHDGKMETIDYEASLQACFAPDELRLVYTPCPECAHDRLVNEKCRKWILRGVPKKVAHATFDNYITGNSEEKTKAKKRVETIHARRSGFVILTGTPGTGKSHLAAALFKLNAGEDGIFMTQADLIGKLRETYDEGGTERLVKQLQRAKCFVLDELDESLGGGDSDRGKDIGPFLYRVLAYRYDRDLITALTSNHDLSKVLVILGPRLEDRMAQNYVAASLTGPSFRRENRVK